MLTKVVEALKTIEGLPGITVDRDIRGFGRTRGEGAVEKIVDDLVEYVPQRSSSSRGSARFILRWLSFR
jgi:PII-like signaling protein